MTEDIIKTVSRIDSQFAVIMSTIMENKYNPKRLYDARFGKLSRQQTKIVRQKFNRQMQPYVHTDPLPNQDVNPRSVSQNTVLQKRQLKGDILSKPSVADPITPVWTRPYDQTIDKDKIQTDNHAPTPTYTSIYKKKPTSQVPYDQTKDTIYQDKTADKFWYVRFIKNDVVNRLNQKAKQRYNQMTGKDGPPDWGGAIGKRNMPYNPNPDESPYNPLRVQLSADAFFQAYNTGKSNGFGSVVQGIGDYYFGNFMRITRRVRNSKYSHMGQKLIGLIAYNILGGTLMNMSSQPARAILGFDIPVINLLSINMGIGPVSGVKYTDPTSLRDQLRDLHRVGGITPDVTVPTTLARAQQAIFDPTKEGTPDLNQFFEAVNTIRNAGSYGTLWKKRKPAGDFDILGKISGLVKNFVKGKGTDGGGRNGVNTLKNVYTQVRGQQYSFDVDNRFYKNFLNIDSNNLITIIIEHRQTLSSLSSIKKLIIPATIKSMGDSVSQSWQDAWTNTGRFQPIKVYMQTDRTMQLSFSVFSFQLFNNVDVQVRSGVKDFITYNKFQVNDSKRFGALQDALNAGDKLYRKQVNWIMQLRYPKMSKSVSRYNVQTWLSVGDYFRRVPVFVNSISVTPSPDFYWVGKFPMVVDVSMSMTVYRQTTDGKIMNSALTQSGVLSHPGSFINGYKFNDNSRPNEIIKKHTDDNRMFGEDTPSTLTGIGKSQQFTQQQLDKNYRSR